MRLLTLYRAAKRYAKANRSDARSVEYLCRYFCEPNSPERQHRVAIRNAAIQETKDAIAALLDAASKL